MSPYEREEALRNLFLGLCQFFEISVRPADDPDDPHDFTLHAGTRQPAYVVVIAGPADRQVEIAALRFHGNKVLVVDEDDLNQLRMAAGTASAGAVIDAWLRDGTHGSLVRERLGMPS